MHEKQQSPLACTRGSIEHFLPGPSFSSLFIQNPLICKFKCRPHEQFKMFLYNKMKLNFRESNKNDEPCTNNP